MLLLTDCKEIPSLGVDLIAKEYYSSVFESEASIIKKGKKINMQTVFFSYSYFMLTKAKCKHVALLSGSSEAEAVLVMTPQLVPCQGWGWRANELQGFS